MNIPSWMKINPLVFESLDPVQVRTSGGKTSALLAYLYTKFGHGDITYDFANTGREDPGTYKFLDRLREHVPIRFFEVRKPLTFGDGPSKMTFEEVAFEKLDRTGDPIRIVLDSIREFRRLHKDLPTVGMNPVMRLCTSYSKIKMLDHVAEAEGWETWTAAIGLRADEPSRTAKMSARDTSRKSSVAPLSGLGITRCMVDLFWEEQEFNLDIQPHQGNCTLCFLKNEADLAEIMLNGVDPDGENWEWWKKLDDEFEITGRGNVRYRQIQEEAPTRFAIRESLHQIKPVPERPEWMDPRRFTLLHRQEKKILRDGIRRVPCSCESAELMTDEFIANAQGCFDLNLPVVGREQSPLAANEKEANKSLAGENI